LKQERNSFELRASETKISNEEEKIRGFKNERKKLETQIANLLAQENASAKKIAVIEDFEVRTLKEEAVDLTNEFQELKEVESSLGRMVRLPEELRFLGKNGDGNATYLRNVHGLASKSDVDQLNRTERKACLTYAAFFGAENPRVMG